PLFVRHQERPSDPAQHVLGVARRLQQRAGQHLQVQAGQSRGSHRRPRGVVLPPPAPAPLMAIRRSPSKAQVRREQMLAAVNYPIDWLEERSGLVGGVRYFLFRKVPGDVNWMQTLGSAALTAFIVQAVTGVILAMYYKPTPNEAYRSIQNITDHVTLGWLVRGMHRWGASVFIILMFLHMGRVFLF